MAKAQWWHAPWLRRVVVSGLLLGAVALWVDPQAIVAQVQRFSPGWVLLALLISVGQVVLSAWRWQLTARLIEVPIRFGYALREYYLALLVNQLLPGGVLGDAGRAHRHASQSASRGRAWRAVIIERVSGQVALGLLTLVALALSPLWHAALGWSVWLFIGIAGVLAVGFTTVVVGLARKGSLNLPRWCLAVGRDIQRGLLTAGVWPLQLLSSLTIVFSYGLVMVCAARAIGVELPVSSLLALAPVMLLAMLVPFSVAGWGVREGAAAGIWVWVGLPTAQGVAVSLAYGVVVLLASLPGLWVAIGRRHAALPPESGRAQQDVEQGVFTTAEGSQRRAQRSVQRFNGGHLQSGPPRADQQRRNKQVQSVDHACLDKLGDRNPAAFDQDSAQLVGVEQFNDIAGLKLASAIQRQHATLHGGGRVGKRGVRPDHMQRRRHVGLKQLPVHRHAATRVEYNAGGVSAANVAHGQLRIIRIGGTGTDDHRIGKPPQSVQMRKAFPTVDVVGVTTLGGDPPIQALPQLGHHPRRRRCQRGQTVRQLAGLSGHRVGVIQGLACQQALPDSVRDDVSVGAQSIRTFHGVGHDASVWDQPLHHAVHGDPAQAPLARHASQPGGFYVSH
ncbi:flippase-like domain-containing protein [Halomonas sp. SH5A2]|nr:flippase-like domain-containing protein [Halomonas sp. SH5A2]